VIWELGGLYGNWEYVPAVHVGNHVDFCLCLCNLLLRGDLGAAAHAEERHLDVYVCWVSLCVSAVGRIGGAEGDVLC
jgi:hypothetical protein